MLKTGQFVLISFMANLGATENILRLFRQGTTLTPNERLTKCCVNMGTITDSCMDLCDYDQFSKEELARVLVRRSCELGELHDLLQCSARWVDHSSCCTNKGVANKCLDYCRPAFQELSAEPQYFICFAHIKQIRQCFFEYDQENPEYA